jgi:hypothetical protein
MPQAKVFGRVDDPDQINLDPFDFTLIGYRETPTGREEVPYKFTAGGVRPFAIQLDIVRAAAEGNGVLQSDKVVRFVEQSLVNDEERIKFRDAIEQPDVYFEAGVLAQISDWLSETYQGRPTRPRTARRSGASRGTRRSTAAASARG